MTSTMAIRRWKINRDGASSFILTLGFIASFIPYVSSTSTSALIGSLSVFLLCAGLALPLLYRDRAGVLFNRLLKPRFAVFALLLPIGPSIVSVNAGKWDAVLYAFLMSLTFTVCQLALGVVTLRRLLKIFSVAGLVSILIFALVEWHGIIHSLSSGARLIPSHAQPNAIAFIFAGFSLVLVGRSLDRNVWPPLRVGFLFVAAAAATIVFLAQSRASLLALGAGMAFAGGVAGIRVIRRKRFAERGLMVLVMLVFAGMLGLFVARPSYVNKTGARVAKMLRLNSQYRGVDSGLSGRIPRWRKTIATIESDGLWVFGSGYRTSTKELGFSVDNGYLTILYEEGMVGLLAVLVQLLWLWRASARRYLRERHYADRVIMLAVFAVVTAFLANNGFDRYLFGLGNPLSLLGLFFLLTDNDVLSARPVSRWQRLLDATPDIKQGGSADSCLGKVSGHEATANGLVGPITSGARNVLIREQSGTQSA